MRLSFVLKVHVLSTLPRAESPHSFLAAYHETSGSFSNAFVSTYDDSRGYLKTHYDETNGQARACDLQVVYLYVEGALLGMHFAGVRL